MIELQFDLFEEQPSELDLLRKDCNELKLQLDKYRKSMFARIGVSGKELIQMQEELYKIRFELDAVRKMIALT